MASSNCQLIGQDQLESTPKKEFGNVTSSIQSTPEAINTPLDSAMNNTNN